MRAQGQEGLILKTIQGQSFQVLSAAHLALVASGTATLEAALAGTPMVIVYRISPLTYRVGRLLTGWSTWAWPTSWPGNGSSRS